MARLIMDERKKYIEHWNIAIRTNTGAFSTKHEKFPHKDGYDSIKISLKDNITVIVVHELSRLGEILKTSLLSEEIKEDIRDEMASWVLDV